ncbi:amidase signature domain-containing protein [Exophiala viscosa]|uniref:amidase n=1 Tax=Exophiala viscosa TaxID=2486360 RepID=A0AAN6DNB6_9EURO|nr:amidase signature domain-containing protein [Exophiala viscosa]
MAQPGNATGLIAFKGIELLTSFTPNGFKVSILLEELKAAYGMTYTYQLIDIFQENVQKEPWFIKLGPNGRIPVIVDHEKGDFAVMETMAILNYLTRTYDAQHQLSFEDPLDICTAEQWMAWVQGGLGPMQAQLNLFYRFGAVKIPYALQHYYGETERLWAVLNTRLAERDYLAGPGRGRYSIADMAAWPFVETCFVSGIDMDKFPHIQKWWDRIGQRPAVQKAMRIPLGQEFPYGYKLMQEKMKQDPEGVEESERPLREALKTAQEEFGYVYKSPMCGQNKAEVDKADTPEPRHGRIPPTPNCGDARLSRYHPHTKHYKDSDSSSIPCQPSTSPDSITLNMSSAAQGSQEAPWQPIAQRKQAERASRIPSKWHIPSHVLPRDPPRPEDGPQNVLDTPRQFLSSSEISITESYTLSTLLTAISSGKLSTEEVTQAFCHRAAIAQQLTNCLTEPLFDSALARAKYLDTYLRTHKKPFGPLHGLPISVKDTFNIKSVDSSIGIASLCHKPATQNSPLIDLLLSLGCVIIAKTNIPQTLASLDSVNNVFGRTMNPINRLCTAGGSSGGEGVLVAMKGSIIGIGTDIGGSIRVPAMCNGVYGFKPSTGRVPYGGQALISLDGLSRTSITAVAGPIARSVEDIDVFLREIVPRSHLFGEDCIPTPWSKSPSQKKSLRIGILRSDNNCTLLPPIANILDEISSKLRSTPNVTVVDLPCPPAWTKCQSVMSKLMGVDGGVTMATLLEATSEPLVPWMSTRFRKGKPQPLTRVAEIQAQRAALEREMLKLWVSDDEEGRRTQTLDAIVCPVAPHPVPPIEGYNAVGMTSSWVLLDYPAGTVPVRDCTESDLQIGKPLGGKALGSWDERNRELWDESKLDRRVYLGTPLSVQIVVPRLQDEQLVEAMGWVDRACKGKGGNVKARL